MSKKAGQLLWNRMQISLAVGATPVDTGLTQVSQAFGNSSVDEPGLVAVGSVGSRVQIIPLAPTTAWALVTHSDPTVVDGTVRVTFSNNGQGPVIINVLFWDPATIAGPGDADLYAIND